MRKKGELFINIIIFLLNPFLGFIIAFYQAISEKENKKYLIILSIFYGYFGLIFLSYENFDIRHHYQVFLKINSLTTDDFYKFLLIQKDWICYILYRVIGYFTENPRWIGFFSAMISYGIPYYIIINYSHKKGFKKLEIFLFLFLFLSITPSYNFSGMRNFNATCSFSLGLYMIEILKRKKGYLFLFLSMLVHISMLPVILIYLLSKFIKLTKLRVLLSLITSILFLGISKIFLLQFLKFFPEYSTIIQDYIIGESAEKIHTFWGVVLFYYVFFFMIVILFYIDNFKRQINNKIYNFIGIYLPIISVLSFSKTLYYRYSTNIEIIMIIIIMHIYAERFRQKRIAYLSIFIFSLSSYFLMVLFEYKTWNVKLLGSSTIGILKEAKSLNVDKELRLIRDGVRVTKF